jgi:predicted nucleotidyltransferase
VDGWPPAGPAPVRPRGLVAVPGLYRFRCFQIRKAWIRGEDETLQEIESILRDQKPILRQRFKVKEIGIFGSFVRGEQKDTSDLDLLIDFEEPIGLIRYVGLQNYLSDKIGERVDLITKSGLKPRISGHILKEVIYV